MAAAVVQAGSGLTAGAGGDAEGIIFIEIIAQLVIGVGIGDVADRALDGDNAHQTVAVRHDRRQILEADTGVFLEGLADLRVLAQQLLVVDKHLADAGGEDLHKIAVLAVGAVLRAAENADPGQVLGELFHLFHTLADLLGQPLGRALVPQSGGDGDVGLVIGDDLRESVVLRRVLVDLIHHTGQAADYLAELDNFGSQFSHSLFSHMKYSFIDLVYARTDCTR